MYATESVTCNGVSTSIRQLVPLRSRCQDSEIEDVTRSFKNIAEKRNPQPFMFLPFPNKFNRMSTAGNMYEFVVISQCSNEIILPITKWCK